MATNKHIRYKRHKFYRQNPRKHIAFNYDIEETYTETKSFHLKGDEVSFQNQKETYNENSPRCLDNVDNHIWDYLEDNDCYDINCHESYTMVRREKVDDYDYQLYRRKGNKWYTPKWENKLIRCNAYKYRFDEWYTKNRSK